MSVTVIYTFRKEFQKFRFNFKFKLASKRPVRDVSITATISTIQHAHSYEKSFKNTLTLLKCNFSVRLKRPGSLSFCFIPQKYFVFCILIYLVFELPSPIVCMAWTSLFPFVPWIDTHTHK